MVSMSTLNMAGVMSVFTSTDGALDELNKVVGVAPDVKLRVLKVLSILSSVVVVVVIVVWAVAGGLDPVSHPPRMFEDLMAVMMRL